MKIVLTDSYDVQLSTALLGYVGETNARPVTVEGLTVDGADRYVLTIDYGDGTVYDVDISDGIWTPTADILRSAQTVSCQIAAKKLSGQEYILLKKSRIFRLRIGAAIGDNAVPSPDVAMDALDKIDAIGRQAHADMQTAVTAAETATAAAENAEKSATTAGVSADTATQAASRAETAKTSAETSATQAETAKQGADTARQQAVTAQNNAKISADLAAAAAQQTIADKTAAAGYAQTAKTAADSAAADRQAVSDMAEQVEENKTTVAENAAQVATDRKAAETAAQTALESAGSVNQLKEDLDEHPWYRKVMPYNIFDYTKCMADSTLNWSNGEISTLSGYSVSDYIEVEENVSYTRNNTSAGTIQCFYDKDKTFISSIRYNREATFSSPTGAKYMRIAISSSTSILSSLMITKGDTISTVFTPYKESFYKYGKYAETSKLKVACFGDSITWGYNDDTDEQVAVPYPSVLKREYGFKEVVNLGISGTTVGGDAQVHDEHQIGSQQNFLSRVDTIPSDTDIICIFGGTNDFGVESYYVPLGTINDTTNLTFYGSLRLLFNYIIPKHIGKKIYYITPIHRQTETKSDNGVSRNLKQYVDAIKDICRYYGVEVIDLYNDGEFFVMNSAFRARYSKSGLHPNQEWYYILGRKIGDRLVEHLN